MAVFGNISGHQIVFHENLRIYFEDDSNVPIPDVTVSITNGNYILNGITNVNGYVDFEIDLTDLMLSFTITYTPTPASGFPAGIDSYTHTGEDDLNYKSIELVAPPTPEFDCDIKYFLEDNNETSNPSSDENTLVDAIFTNIVVPTPSNHLGIIQQYTSEGTTDEGVYAYPESEMNIYVNGFELIYEINLTPDQITQRGDVFTARITDI